LIFAIFGSNQTKNGKKWKVLAFSEAKKIGIIFAKIFVIFSRFRKLSFSELSKIYKKMTLNSNFGNREKLVPTRKPTQKFG